MKLKQAIKVVSRHITRVHHRTSLEDAWNRIKEELDNRKPSLTVTTTFPDCPVCGTKMRSTWASSGKGFAEPKSYCHNCERLDSSWPCELGGW